MPFLAWGLSCLAVMHFHSGDSDDAEPIVIFDDDAIFPVSQRGPDTSQPVATAAHVVPQPEPVTASTAGAGLVFVEHDAKQESCLYQAGPIRCFIDSRDGAGSKRRVALRCNGKVAQDHLDLAVLAQRQRFAGSAARRLGQPAETITRLLAELLTAVLAREAERDRGPAVTISPADQAAGLALLEAPDLLTHVVEDCTTLGWVGEASAKMTLYLAAISRLLPNPIWSVSKGSTASCPWQGIRCISSLVPPEAITIFRCRSPAALAVSERNSLRHQLLILDQAEALRPDAALALRVLHERAGVGAAGVAPGSSASGELRGPVAALAAVTTEMELRCRDAFMVVPVDESTGLTESILADQRRRLAEGTTNDKAVAAVIARHHAAQRLLETLPIRIPYADRVVFPATRMRHRVEQQWFLGLVAACALLHQRQRQRIDGAVMATEGDFHAVVSCTAGIIGATGLSSARRTCSSIGNFCTRTSTTIRTRS